MFNTDILNILKENDLDNYIEELWQEEKHYYAICKFLNGRYYNYYDITNKELSPEGSFLKLDDAINDLKKHNTKIKKIWSKEIDNINYSNNLNLLYITTFSLSNSVLDFEKASEFLLSDNMTKYAKYDNRISKSGRDKVNKIIWTLKTNSTGEIQVYTNNYLTKQEIKELSSWIKGQCSDGIGESFSEINSIIEKNYIVEFDWKHNNYLLELKA